MYVFRLRYSAPQWCGPSWLFPGTPPFGVIWALGCAQASLPVRRRQRAGCILPCLKVWLTAAVAHGLYDFLIMGLGGGVIFYVYFIGIIAAGVFYRRDRGTDGPVDFRHRRFCGTDQPQERF